ncbi:unnamed protein product [Sphacelaria rigidula]
MPPPSVKRCGQGHQEMRIRGQIGSRQTEAEDEIRPSGTQQQEIHEIGGEVFGLEKSVNSLRMQAVEHHNILTSFLSRGDRVAPEDLVQAALHLGTIVSQAMAIVDGGLRHANKSVGPRSLMEKVCPDAIRDEEFYSAEGHAVGFPCELHKTPPPDALAGGEAGVVEYHRRKIIANCAYGARMVVICCDRCDLVPPIKTHEHVGRQVKVKKCDRVFNATCTDGLPAGLEFQSYIRAANNRSDMAQAICESTLGDTQAFMATDAKVIFDGVEATAICPDVRSPRHLRSPVSCDATETANRVHRAYPVRDQVLAVTRIAGGGE